MYRWSLWSRSCRSVAYIGSRGTYWSAVSPTPQSLISAQCGPDVDSRVTRWQEQGCLSRAGALLILHQPLSFLLRKHQHQPRLDTARSHGYTVYSFTARSSPHWRPCITRYLHPLILPGWNNRSIGGTLLLIEFISHSLAWQSIDFLD